MLCHMEIDFTQPPPRPKTLEQCYDLIDALWALCAPIPELQKQIHELKIEMTALKKENAELKEKLNLNSNNSSKPPSSDFFKKNKKNKLHKNKSNRKQGGQPGHSGHYRVLLPPNQVDHFVTHKPPLQCECGEKIVKSGKLKRHQIHELPEVRPVVTEHQFLFGVCVGCGKQHCAAFPKGISRMMIGPIALAKIALLTGKYRMSKRNVMSLFEDFFGFSLSTGTISNAERVMNPILEKPVQEVQEYLKKQPNVYSDETSHKERDKRMWAWVGATRTVCTFFIRKSRGMTVAQEILGKNFSGVLNSDRFTAYNWVDNRQLCWSHLKRDFVRISERSGESGRIGDCLLLYHRKMFKYWNFVKDGTLSREKYCKLMLPIRSKIEGLLTSGTKCGHSKTEKTCEKILEFKEGLWTFIDRETIEPTNNHSERLLRWLVIWRKTSFGTQSERGSRYMERILTVTSSCQLQKRNILEYLSESITGYLNQSKMPSLLPG
jgi:transposase